MNATAMLRFTLGLARLVLGALRRTWLVTAVTVAICAAFAAHAATAIIAADHIPPGASPPLAAAAATVRSRPRGDRTQPRELPLDSAP